MTLTKIQEQRYLRNLLLPEIGVDGQERLLGSRVLVVGAGGLGSPVIFYLSAAGVGNLTIIDNDVVELSNLQRQIIHNGADLGRAKVLSAKEKVFALDENIKITTHQIRADAQNLPELVRKHDVILDCSDNFNTRFLINKVCFEEKKPLIFAAVKGFLGQVSVFKSFENENPCYCCFNSNLKEKNSPLPLSEKGILGAVAGSFGAIQATNAIKEILGIGESLVGKILISDLLKNEIRKVSLKKNSNCKICSKIC